MEEVSFIVNFPCQWNETII